LCLLSGVEVMYAANVDLSKGVIAGRIAIMGVPDGTPATDDCRVYLALIGDEIHPRLYRCGSWFQPPVGRYLYWIEQQSLVSAQTVINYGGEPFRRFGALFPKKLMRAGRVVLSRKSQLASDAELRLLSLMPDGEHRPFDRRVSATEARLPIRLPVGKAIAGIFDRKGNAIALSPPIAVSDVKTTVVKPQKPDGGKASLLVVLNRPMSSDAAAECSASAIGAEPVRVKIPDIELKTRDRLVFVWYVLEPSKARVDVRCSGLPDFIYAIHPVENSIVTIRKDMKLGR
jgi:hypothetical protein